MENVTTLVRLSNIFRAATSVDELDRLRDEHRPEVKKLLRDEQSWLLDEWESAKWCLEYVSPTDEEMQKMGVKSEAERDCKDGEGLPGVGGVRKRPLTGRYEDHGIDREQAK